MEKLLFFIVSWLQNINGLKPVEIKIIDAPTDWHTIQFSFLATLIGAFTAFALTAFYEYRKEHNKRINAVNLQIIKFGINVTRLLNLKLVLIEPLSEDWAALKAEMEIEPSVGTQDDVTNRWRNIVSRHFNIIKKKSPNFNGFLQKWNEMEFIEFNAEALNFFSDFYPDILRLIEEAKQNIQMTAHIIKKHNEAWAEYKNELHSGLSHPKYVYILYDFLSLQSHLEEAVNSAIASIMKSIQLLQIQTDKHLLYKNTFLQILFGKKKIHSILIPKKLESLIPAEENYRKLFEPSDFEPSDKEIPNEKLGSKTGG